MNFLIITLNFFHLFYTQFGHDSYSKQSRW